MSPQSSGAGQTKSGSTRQTKTSTRQTERTYVLDTSVLLSDPTALTRFAEHSVVIPVIVISELEKKRHDPEIGYFARQALRKLDDLREKHERLDFPIPIGEGGSLRVELNHSNQAVLPSGLQLNDNDSRILAVALNLANDGLDVTVVSKDLPMRVKASSIGLQAASGRRPIVLVGDGAFQMTGWELGNCRRYGWDPIVIVMNNCGWEMLRVFQPTSGFNTLDDWRFAELAAPLGGDGVRVTTRRELAVALETAAGRRGRFQLIEAMIPPGSLSPTLEGYVAALQRRTARA